MKTLYLHIGTPKTGTSAIQDFLVNNQEVLDKKGYCFKLMPYRYTRGACIKRNGHFLVGKIYDEGWTINKIARRERIDEGMKLVDEWFQSYDKVILTDEAVWNAMARREHKSILAYVKQFCDEREIQLKVIVYLRSQDDYVESWWRQKVRSGTKMKEWDKFIRKLPKKKLITDYYGQLCKIVEDIGKESLIVRRYEKGSFLGANQTIFSDFLDAIGLEFTDEYVVEREFVNTSLHNNYAEIKRILNELLDDTDPRPFGRESQYFGNIGIRCSNLDCVKSYQSSMFSGEEQKEFLEKYAEGNRKIAQEFLGEDGDLFHPTISELPKWQKNNPRQYDDLVLFMGAAFLDNRTEIEGLRQEIADMGKEMAILKKELAVYKKKLDDCVENFSAMNKVVAKLKSIKNKVVK